MVELFRSRSESAVAGLSFSEIPGALVEYPPGWPDSTAEASGKRAVRRLLARPTADEAASDAVSRHSGDCYRSKHEVRAQGPSPGQERREVRFQIGGRRQDLCDEITGRTEVYSNVFEGYYSTSGWKPGLVHALFGAEQNPVPAYPRVSIAKCRDRASFRGKCDRIQHVQWQWQMWLCVDTQRGD